MRRAKDLEFSLLLSVITLLTISLILPSCLHPSSANPDYTYYGVVPSNIYLHLLNDPTNTTSGWVMGTNGSRTGSPGINGMTVATHALLSIVASEDGTNVRVYDLADGSLLDQKTIDSMEKDLVLLANGTEFKVVSDKQVSVLLLNYQMMPATTATEGPLPYTFHTNVNGLYVGKDFYLMGSEQVFYTENKFYTVFAVEKSTVTVTRDDGQANDYTIEANSYTTLMCDPFRVFRIESTGNIMVESSVTWGDIGGGVSPHRYRSSILIPCATGGFVGQFFYAKSTTSWDPDTDYGFRISATEDTKVKVYSLQTMQLTQELSVTGGTGLGFQPAADAIAVQSDKPITLSYINNGSLGTSRTAQIGVGMMFMGVQPNEATPIYLPTEANVEVYFFASQQTELTVDGSSQTIQLNEPKQLILAGNHILQADHSVVLQVNFWPNTPEYQGFWFPAAAIPSIETVADNPAVTITPLEGGFPTTYIIVGVGAAAAVAVVAVVMLRRRSGKPS